MRRRRRGFAPLLPPGTTLSDQEYADWYDEHAWNPSNYDGLSLERDLEAAEWLEALLTPRSFTVSMSAPLGYESYARIFFPFVDSGIDANGEWFTKKITWADRAHDHGMRVHALMEEETISSRTSDPGATDRCSNRLSPEQFEALLPILTSHTSSTEGWFLLWDGFGNLNEEAFNARIPKVHHWSRDLYLLRGSLASYGSFADDPNFWWPDDRAWCLCTDTDFSWSYLAGTRRCIDEILATPVLDAVQTVPDNPAHSGMDIINDPGNEVPRRG